MASFLPSGPKNERLAPLVSRIPILEHRGLVVRVQRFHQSVNEGFFTTGWCTHPHFELALVRAGVMRYESRKSRIEARTRQMILIPPGAEHRRTTVKLPAVLDGWHLQIEARHASGRPLLRALEADCLSRSFLLETPGKLPALAALIDSEISRSPAFVDARLSALLIEMILEVLRPLMGDGAGVESPRPAPPAGKASARRVKNTESQSTTQRGAPALEEAAASEAMKVSARERQLLGLARDFVDSRLGEALDTAQVAERLEVGERYVNLLFNRSEERSCGDYIRERRLLKAYELIDLSPGRRIHDIARTVGFDDPLYFSKLFRKRFGLTAREVRDRRLR